MAKIHARNGSLYVEDSSGACQAMSALVSSITLGQSSDAPDVTGFGEDRRQRLSNGIKDWELSMNGFWSSGANETDEVLSGILGGSTMFYLGPSGSTSTCVQYSACGVLTEYNIDLAVEDAATIAFTMMSRSGSLTRGTWA